MAEQQQKGFKKNNGYPFRRTRLIKTLLCEEIATGKINPPCCPENNMAPGTERRFIRKNKIKQFHTKVFYRTSQAYHPGAADLFRVVL